MKLGKYAIIETCRGDYDNIYGGKTYNSIDDAVIGLNAIINENATDEFLALVKINDAEASKGDVYIITGNDIIFGSYGDEYSQADRVTKILALDDNALIVRLEEIPYNIKQIVMLCGNND